MEWKEEDHKKSRSDKKGCKMWWRRRRQGVGGIMKRVFNEAVQDHHQRLLIHSKLLQTGARVLARLWPAEMQGIYRHMSRGAYYRYIGRQPPESCNIRKLGGLIRLPDVSKSIYQLSGKNNTQLSFWGWIAHIPNAVYPLLLSHSALSIRL